MRTPASTLDERRSPCRRARHPAARASAVNNPACAGRQKELMRAMPDAELTQAILGNVKVASAGMASAAAKMKKQAKKKH